MDRDKVIQALATLGSSMKSPGEWNEVIDKAHQKNQWFIPDFVRQALHEWSLLLNEESISNFANQYSYAEKSAEVGIVMAGNVPMVGLHDLICVLLAGHTARVKCSKEDEVLIGKVISELEKEGVSQIEKVDRISSSDAVIATGSNNTSRYFEYYFRNAPHVIRRNRTSVAVLTEEDDENTYRDLAKDVFMYFGLGCRNVGKIFIPRNFSLPKLLDQWQSWQFLADHNKYVNNYIYHRALFLMNQQQHLDNGFLLLKEDQAHFSPLGCLYFERYDDLSAVKSKLAEIETDIQCVVSTSELFEGRVMPGKSQSPGLDVFADQVNTMQFLAQL